MILYEIWQIMHNYAIIQNYAILCDFMKIMQYRIDRVKSSSLVKINIPVKITFTSSRPNIEKSFVERS